MVMQREKSPFEGAKRPRKKKSDVEIISEIRTELDKQQQAEETAHKPVPESSPKTERR